MFASWSTAVLDIVLERTYYNQGIEAIEVERPRRDHAETTRRSLMRVLMFANIDDTDIIVFVFAAFWSTCCMWTSVFISGL